MCIGHLVFGFTIIIQYHRAQVSVLSQMHLQQAGEKKSQSQEVRHLATLLEKHQGALERVQANTGPVPTEELLAANIKD